MPPGNATGARPAPPPPLPPAHLAAARAAAPRRALVRVYLAATAAVFVLTVALLFYGWVIVREPTSVIEVAGTPRFEGMTVTVDGVALPGPHVGTITAADDYRLPIFVDRGSYTLRITDGERVVYETGVLVGRGHRVRFDLSLLEPLLDVGAATRRSAIPPSAR